MNRFPVLSRRSVRNVAVALGLLLTVVGTVPEYVAAEDATIRGAQTLAPAPEPTQALLLPAVQAAREAARSDYEANDDGVHLVNSANSLPQDASPKLFESLADGRH